EAVSSGHSHEQRPSLEAAETVDLTDLLNQVVSVCEQRRCRRHLTDDPRAPGRGEHRRTRP
ncbi:hypothetical protein, partial [Thermogemmatispora sp.]|uniref:hypothetical protein n=1 Tax=Thermogemmatispora sp. TaxID=1968838 RepID=UPI00257FDE32